MKLFLTLFILISISACAPKIPKAQTRLNLKMPSLLDMKRFRSDLPLVQLRDIRSKAKEDEILTPNLTYSFIINENGDVISGK